MQNKSLATAVATLLAAFATAHLMQFGMSAGRALSGEGSSVPIGLATFIARQADGPPEKLPQGPSSLPTPAAAATTLSLPATRDLPGDTGVPEALASPAGSGFGLSCERSLTVGSAPAAMLRTEVRAPCDPGVRVEISHAGVRFAVETGRDGRIGAAVPAMTPDALVEARFADGTILRAHATVPEAARLERVAVVSDGWASLTLHAFEFGAGRDAPGHIHSGAQHVRPGTLYRLGDAGIGAPLTTEVYTLPSGRLGPLGDVRLEIELAVTPGNCARDVAATVVRTTGGGTASGTLRLAVPACDAAGEVLVIELPSPELRVARN